MNLDGKQEKNEYLHSWYVLIITFFSLVFLLLNRYLIIDAFLVFFVFTIYFKNGLNISKFKKLFFYAFLFSFGLFVLNVLYPAKELQKGAIYSIGKLTFYGASIDKSLTSLYRLFLVSLLSMSSGVVIDYTKVILHLIVHKGLKLFWGYPLLLAMNSVALFKEEFDRIKINAKMRNLPLKDKLFLFFPLLVFAIRHSQRGALSLVTRGLNEKKTFYFSYDVTNSDKKRLFLFWVVYFGLVILAVMKLR